MEVWLEKLPDGAKPYQADGKCPYCGGSVVVETTIGGGPGPESAECPHCGRGVGLLVEWEPIVGLVKNRRYEEE